MNVVFYYSNTGESKKIAKFFAEQTGYPLLSIEEEKGAEKSFKDVIFVFPVYCQNIPNTAKRLLCQLKAERLVLVATYGRMCYGNVLCEAQKLVLSAPIIAAAYVPTKHSYLYEPSFESFDELLPLLEKMKYGKDAKEIKIPRSYKNPFANFAMDGRSRIGVKMWRDEKCTYCGKCEKECVQKAIINGKINKNCIRCMKCVVNCPVGALHFSNRLPLHLYLKKKKTDKVVLYI